MWQTCRSSLIANSQVRKPTSFRFASSNSAIRVFKSSKRPGLTASSIVQYTFSFIKSFLKNIAALQETATKAMQTARLAKIAQEAQDWHGVRYKTKFVGLHRALSNLEALARDCTN